MLQKMILCFCVCARARVRENVWVHQWCRLKFIILFIVQCCCVCVFFESFENYIWTKQWNGRSPITPNENRKCIVNHENVIRNVRRTTNHIDAELILTHWIWNWCRVYAFKFGFRLHICNTVATLCFVLHKSDWKILRNHKFMSASVKSLTYNFLVWLFNGRSDSCMYLAYPFDCCVKCIVWR